MTKKLLSAVVGKELTLDHLWRIDGNELFYYEVTDDDYYEGVHLNLDTLGKKCKLWCKDHGYTVMSTCGHANITLNNSSTILRIFDNDTEPKAIIEAIEWVAKKVGLK